MSRSHMAVASVGLIAGLGLAASVLTKSDVDSTPLTPVPGTVVALEAAPEQLGDAGTLTDLDGWLNTSATSLDEARGTVTILQFWTYACSNCKATLPHLQQIYAEYRSQGLQIIGVHSPEFSFEEDPANVVLAAADLGVTWPIALDTRKTNFRSWQGSRRFWPRTYVIDNQGQIRFNHVGEGSYDELESTVAWLLERGGS